MNTCKATRPRLAAPTGVWLRSPKPAGPCHRAPREGLRPDCYLHPWQLDPEQPRLALPPARRLRHYTGLAGTASKLRRLLAEFGCRPILALYAAELAGRALPAAPALAPSKRLAVPA